MSRSRLRLSQWIIGILFCLMAGSITAQEVTPQPTINMLGFQRENNQIEWIITVGNVGDDIARNVVITDNLPHSLQVDHIQINTGTANINNQTVTVVLPHLEPQEIVQFSLFTSHRIDENTVNTVCVTADGVAALTCVPAMAVKTLPDTGESPFWRNQMVQLGLLTISFSLLIVGMGLFGWQSILVQQEEDVEPESLT